MTSTTFYPTDAQRVRLATAYAKNKGTGALEPVPPRAEYGPRDRPPQGNGGLYSTAPDYARFCQMLLNGGTLDGRRYLSAEAMKFLTTPQTGDLPTGFFQSDTNGNRGANYGWGITTSILRVPHDGVAAMLSPGTYGHGGAWGTQAWIDPVKGVAYILMVQRSNFPNSDGSVRPRCVPTGRRGRARPEVARRPLRSAAVISRGRQPIREAPGVVTVLAREVGRRDARGVRLPLFGRGFVLRVGQHRQHPVDELRRLFAAAGALRRLRHSSQHFSLVVQRHLLDAATLLLPQERVVVVGL